MRLIKRKNASYLQHSYRKYGKIITKEYYIKDAKDIEYGKKELYNKCRKDAFYDLFDQIKKAHQEEQKKLPAAAKERWTEELTINFTYNTNAIEGSTITEKETRDIVQLHLAPRKSLYDIKETEQHAKLFKEILAKKEEITLSLLLDWHKQLFSDTKPEIAGTIRDYLVRVGSYIAPDWQDLPKLLEGCIAFCNTKEEMHPVEFAARVHYRFESIHPFGDGNGRIGRLLMNAILWHAGYPILSIEYKKRSSYYHAFSKDEEYFVQYFLRRYLSTHKTYISPHIERKDRT